MESLTDDPILTTDHAVRDWSISSPRLRREIRFHYQNDHGQPIYVIEDLANRRYLQVGLPEYRFIRGLDGNRTVAMLLAENARNHEDIALTESEAIAVLRWLLDNQLLEATSIGQTSRRHQMHEEHVHRPKKKSLMTLVFHRIPLGNPDQFLGVMNRLFGWTFSMPVFMVWLLLVSYGGYLAAENWRALSYAGSSAVIPSNWLFLLIVFVVLKVIHEIWHGIATKRFGGIVPECGIQLIALVTPLTYVDASASWSFPTRRERWVVAAAGMYIELAIATVALIFWSRTSPGLVNSISANVVFAASTITLLFNANPLMRFDGYYMLSDALGIKNLGTKGSLMMKWLGKTLIMGIRRIPLPTGTRKDRFLIGAYGIAAAIWRVLLTIGILLIVGTLFKGIGLILAGIIAISIVAAGLFGFTRFLFSREPGLRIHVAAVRIGLIVGTLASLLWFVQIQPAPVAPAVVEYPGKDVLRAECPGFVEDILVSDGDPVEKGQLLVRLQNREETGILEKIRIEIRRIELESRLSFQDEEYGLYEADRKKIEGLREQEKSQAARVSTLEMRAPSDGVVSAVKLENLLGGYVTMGTKILTVLPPDDPRIVISASQESLRSLATPPVPARLRLYGRGREIAASVNRVESRATAGLPHPALAATNGGPLPVRQSLERKSERLRGLASETYEQEALSHFGGLEQEVEAPVELMRTRFAAYARLDLDSTPFPTPLREGEWGLVRLTGEKDQRLGTWLFYNFYDFVIRGLEKTSSGTL